MTMRKSKVFHYLQQWDWEKYNGVRYGLNQRKTQTVTFHTEHELSFAYSTQNVNSFFVANALHRTE